MLSDKARLLSSITLLLLIIASLLGNRIGFAEELRKTFDGLPWITGDRLDGIWQVEGYIAHAEFIRMVLSADGKQTQVEISIRQDDGSPWNTKYYRIQPAPQKRPPLSLLKLVRQDLLEAEKKLPGHPIIGKLPRDIPGDNDQYSNKLYGAGLSGTFMLFIILAAAWLATRPKRKTEKAGPIGFALRIFLLFSLILSTGTPRNGKPLNPSKYLKTALALLAASAALMAFFVIDSPAPLFADTAKDLAHAKDCIDGPGCHFRGVQTSFRGMMQGAAWLHWLVLLTGLGASVAKIQWATLAVHAIGIGFFFAFSAIYYGLARGVLAGLLFFGLSLWMVHYPVLWNPSFVVLPLVLWTIFLAKVTVSGKSLYSFLAGIAFAFCCDSHMIFLILLPLQLFLCAALAKRPFAGIAACLAGLALVWVIESHETLIENFFILKESALILPFALGSALATAIGCRFDLFRNDRETAWRVLPVWITLYVSLVLIAALYGLGHIMRPWYLLPLLPSTVLLLTNFSMAMLLWPIRKVTGQKRSIALSMSLALIAVAWFVCRYEPLRDISYRNCEATWTLSDAERIAAKLYGEGWSYEGLRMNLRGENYYPLLLGLGVMEPAKAKRKTSFKPLWIVKTDKSRHDLSQWPQIDRIDLNGDAQALLASGQSIIDWEDFRVCYGPKGKHRLEARCIETGISRERSNSNPDSYSLRAYPRLEGIYDIRQPSFEQWEEILLEYEFRIEVRSDSPLMLATIGDWKIEILDGVKCDTSYTMNSLNIRPGQAGKSGRIKASLVVSRSRIDKDSGYPPAIFEGDPKVISEMLKHNTSCIW